MTIHDSFNGPYRFLSNFYAHSILYGEWYRSAEHAYQAAKCLHPEDSERIRHASSPGEAKKIGRTVPMHPDWDARKIQVMTEIIRIKFQVPSLARKLLATGEAELVEGNTWKDTFWGRCRGVGENNLGKILMQVRDEIREGR